MTTFRRISHTARCSSVQADKRSSMARGKSGVARDGTILPGARPNPMHPPGMLAAHGFAAALGLLAPGFAAAPAFAQEQSGFWQRSTAAVNATTSFPLGSKAEQERGWFSGAWDGTKRIWREGTHDLYLSGYTWHLPYAYTTAQRNEENALTYGLGFGKTLTDERDNQRSLYALVINDSNYNLQFTVGYAWMARWRLAGGLRGGLGYSAVLVAREDYFNYVPFPAIVPLASLGNDTFTLFATYIPFAGDVVYVFGRIAFDAPRK